MAEEQSTATLTAEAGDVQELVTCTLNDVEFGLDINAVQEIVRIPKITPIPRSPDYVEGVANLRGNVLSVISSRRRFGMPDKKDENNRVIVVELNGVPTGLVVDAVREVMHVKKEGIEPTPPAVHGVDSKFLSGVVKLDEGKRLIMLLSHDEIIDLGDFATSESAATSKGQTSSAVQEKETENVENDNEQLVTFRLDEEEYGISIMEVQEIIRVPEITAVPNAPGAVQGITSLRSEVLPVVDLRTKFGFRTLQANTDRFCAKLKGFQKHHDEWVKRLAETVTGEGEFDEDIDYSICDFTGWLRSYSTNDRVIAAFVEPLREIHKTLHQEANAVLALYKDNHPKEAAARYQDTFKATHDGFDAAFKKLFAGVEARMDERCLVVNIGKMSLALRIDAVNEVLQVPKASLESTPEIVAGKGASRDQIRGVAKMDDGKRLIMFLGLDKLVSEQELQAISSTVAKHENDKSSDQEGTKSTDTATEGDERQLVTFKVADEEFAADIMQVQEIVRLEKVTKVPHAPSFVEGVVNLRGNVLPVIDLRRRFDMDSKDYDDATRVVVVDVNGQKTGIIVDAVSEVMRMPTADIEPAPAIVKAGYGEDFLEGVGRLEGGERMLLLLRADKLLSEEEMSAMTSAVADTSPVDEEAPAAEHAAEQPKSTGKKKSKKKGEASAESESDDTAA